MEKWLVSLLRRYIDRVAYRMRGEEDELVGEDRAPDYGGENPDAGLRDGSSPCTFGQLLVAL